MAFETPLCAIAYGYGTDKCPQIRHSYTPLYYRLLHHKREQVKKVLEIGIGCPATMIDTPDYATGASLKMWRDYFPNATIFGVDILPEAMFVDERIITFNYDATIRDHVEELIKYTGKDLDIIIDDGSHWRRDQINACQNIMPLINAGAYYFIEDIEHPITILRHLSEYDCLLFNGTNKKRSDKMLLVRHK